MLRNGKVLSRPLDSHIGHRPLTVEFIDNHLPVVHPAFVNPPVHYDTMAGQYVSNDRTVSASSSGAMKVSNSHASLGIYSPSDFGPPSNLADPPPRPEWTNTKAMQYWNTIIIEALVIFRETTKEPDGRSGSQYSIREKDDWDAIYDTLKLSQDHYKQTGGRVGWFRKIRRKAADNVAPLAGAAFIAFKAVPDNTYSTPVLGAVGVLLDVSCVHSLPQSTDHLARPEEHD